MLLAFRPFSMTGRMHGEPSLFCRCRPRLTYLGSGAKLCVGGMIPLRYIGRLFGLGVRELLEDKGSLGGTFGGRSSSLLAPDETSADQRRESPVLIGRGGIGTLGGTSGLSRPCVFQW